MIVNHLSVSRLSSYYKVLALLGANLAAIAGRMGGNIRKSRPRAGAMGGYSVYIYTEIHRSVKLSVNHNGN